MNKFQNCLLSSNPVQVLRSILLSLRMSLNFHSHFNCSTENTVVQKSAASRNGIPSFIRDNWINEVECCCWNNVESMMMGL